MNSVLSILKISFLTRLFAVVSITIMLFIGTACEKKKDKQVEPNPAYEKLAQSSSQRTSPSQAMSSAMSKKMVVTTVQNAGRYSYIEGENNGVRTWIASNQLQVMPGDTIQYQTGPTMIDFHSKSLNRTFDKIIFAGYVSVVDQGPAGASAPGGSGASRIMSQSATRPQMENPHGKGFPSAQPVGKNISVQKVEGGYTVEELYTKKKELNGQTVKVRGKVVKFLPGIMKKNWIHLQDGTGAQGTNDLTITTQDVTKKGDTIVCTGKLIVDKDFGRGYAYALIMEEASITAK